MHTNIITTYNNRDFNEAQGLINKAFRRTQQIPNLVFNEKFNQFFFEEFDWAMTPEFWNTIQRLALASNDTDIFLTVLDPDPINYFFDNFGYYNSMKLPVNITGKDYENILQTGPKDSPADAVLYNSEVIVWLPVSMKWAIWGERSCGICILAFTKDSNLKTPEGRWQSVHEALKDLIAVDFREKKIPKEFADSLIENYSK